MDELLRRVRVVLDSLLSVGTIDQALYERAMSAAVDINREWAITHQFDELFAPPTVEEMHVMIRELQKELARMSDFVERVLHERIVEEINSQFPNASVLQDIATICRNSKNTLIKPAAAPFDVMYLRAYVLAFQRLMVPDQAELPVLCADGQHKAILLAGNHTDFFGDPILTEDACVTECGHVFETKAMKKWFAMPRKNDCQCPFCRNPVNQVFTLQACDQGNQGGSRKTIRRNKKHKHIKNKARKSRKHRKSSRKH